MNDMMNWKSMSVGFVMVLAAAQTHAQPAASATNHVTFRETSLGLVTVVAEYSRVTVSQDQNHIAFPILKDGCWHVLRDGVIDATNREIKQIESLRFTPDGEHLVYFARLKSGQWATVRDGVVGLPYARSVSSAPVFSADGEHTAFVLCRGEDQVLMLDGKEAQVYPGAYNEGGEHSGKDAIDVRTLVFGGSRLSYAVIGKDWQQVVADGQPGKKYQAISSPGPRYSPDGSNLVFGARIDSNQWVIVRNGQESAPIAAKAVLDFTFAPSNSAVMGYLKLIDPPLRMQAVIQDKPGKDYFAIGVDTLRFSPDGQHSLYVGGTESQQHVVIDGQESDAYFEITPKTPRFSPDGQHHAFGAITFSDTGYSVAVIDGKRWGRFDFFVPGSFAYSPDGRHLAFVGTRNNKAILVVDQVEVRELDLVPIPDKKLFYGKLTPIFDGPNRFHLQAARRTESLDVEIFRIDAEIH